MRIVTLALLTGVTLAWLPAAQAADLDYGVLRGPDYEPASTEIDWNGGYFGGHAGYTTTSLNFGPSGQSDLAQILRNTAVESEYRISGSNTLKPARPHDVGIGGFAGYNYQFDDAVIGLEVDYTSVNQKGRSEDSLTRRLMLSNGTYDIYKISTAAHADLRDYATIRMRAGYPMGAFLPFVTAGLAIGRAVVGNDVSVDIREYSDTNLTNLVGGLSQSGGTSKEKYSLGYALGIGGDYLLTQNIFVRGEYQYLQFAKFGDVKVNVNTVRGAVGIKF